MRIYSLAVVLLFAGLVAANELSVDKLTNFVLESMENYDEAQGDFDADVSSLLKLHFGLDNPVDQVDSSQESYDESGNATLTADGKANVDYVYNDAKHKDAKASESVTRKDTVEASGERNKNEARGKATIESTITKSLKAGNATLNSSVKQTVNLKAKIRACNRKDIHEFSAQLRDIDLVHSRPLAFVGVLYHKELDLTNYKNQTVNVSSRGKTGALVLGRNKRVSHILVRSKGGVRATDSKKQKHGARYIQHTLVSL